MDVLNSASMALASDILAEAPCSIELPAGTGKTQLIASIANVACALEKRTLILTHTNAGVTVIKNRLRRFGINPSICSVATICSWAERVSRAYPLLSQIDTQIKRGAPDYYDQCVLGATKLCSYDAFATVLSASYSLILIDEYQDCDMLQHRLAIALRNVIGSVAVFGDRLQRIFDFRHQEFPDWSSEIETSFPPLGGILPKPYRWMARNPALGRWLLEHVRPELLAGRRLDFETLKVPNVKHITSSPPQTELIQSARAMRQKYEKAAILCPNLPLAYSEKLAKRLAGSFELIEEMEGRFARERLAAFPLQSGSGAKAKWLAELALQCHSSLSTVLNEPVLCALQEGRSLNRYKSAKARQGYIPLLEKLQLASEDFNSARFREACKSIRVCCGSHLVRHEAWSDALFAVETHFATGESPAAAFERTRTGDRFRPSKPTAFMVSRVLLIKGLEFDGAAVVKASDQKAYSKENLYVALTRPTSQLLLFD